ncbi:ribosomal-protein-alanine N-acetyltransferase [Pedobacter terrae]|uniref:Ribosomal-protein-alanine N-acetyltransferase n=1 Tax=Pedobacter terrae TaxID=405671 RepID=A0A1G7RI77_9SPHI|nr:GNAT family N-acetyltransferase [Pedobacter terrae]SDG10451.1 ribosomal-protein-alanine N-acetyltransferase [Pedobacter terrae]
MFDSFTLHTERFLLRQFCASDLAFVFKGLSHPDVIRYYGVSYMSLSHTKDQLIWFDEIQKNGTGIWWAICDKERLTFLGGIGLNDLNKSDQKAEIGFWLLPEHWGKGIVKEVANPICNYAFENLGLRKIEAMVETENENSKKVLKKIGFDYQETLKGYEIKNDESISLEIYIKLKVNDIT